MLSREEPTVRLAFPLTELLVNSGLSSVRNSCPEKASRPFDVFADSGVALKARSFLIEEKRVRWREAQRSGRSRRLWFTSGSREKCARQRPPACMREALDDAG
jgi:hypothetical protein